MPKSPYIKKVEALKAFIEYMNTKNGIVTQGKEQLKYNTPEFVDEQIKIGLSNDVFPFPVFYAFVDDDKSTIKIKSEYFKKDLTLGTHQEYTKVMAERAPEHVARMAQLMDDLKIVITI